ncbi:MAG: RdgB/HAM1 family non-canonical purine NTP pyrophosphatase [Gammaproteobacteria bacterium]|nr:MAG: RdgB/HAM1 family non-canonical purine NTP pyrophosphatase [Gammaproteobacteria bacterium]
MSVWVLATGNTGKVREIGACLAPFGITLCPQSDYDVIAAEETGKSFVENALIKARNAAMQTGLPSLADDSGIEVDALNGRPGIHSARFAGAKASDEENIRKLLSCMDGVENRRARFVCVLALVRNAEDPNPVIFEGRWEGRIAEKPSGNGGFGYDPIFFVPRFNCTAAELAPEQKAAVSHRAQALLKLRLWLAQHDSLIG